MRTFTTYETKWGTGAVIFSEKGLAGVLFPQPDEVRLEALLENAFGPCEYDASNDYGLSSTLARYYKGERVHFDIQLDYGDATEFERRVWDELKAVPYGETTSYKELAERCGRPKAARAVGNAMMKNRVPIVVPCHRVLKSDGTIGGWSGMPGWKERLLEIEGIV